MFRDPRLLVNRDSTFTDSAGSSFEVNPQLVTDRGFGDGETEKRFRDWNLNENIKMGARTMILWTLVLIGMRTVIYWAKPKVLTDSIPLLQLVLTRGIEYGFLGISLIPLLICLKTPRASMYLPVVVLHFIYVLGMNLPPYAYSCEDLFLLVQKDGSSFFGARRKLATEHLDCTLQGHTSQQLCMTWLLITPRVIPRLRMMHFVWIWIFLGYLGVTLWYRNVFDEMYFSEWDMVVSIFFQVFTNCIAYNRKFYLEKSQRNKWMYDMKEKEASQKVYCILDYMVPDHVILPMLFNPGAVIADPVERASILFIMICDFEEYAHSLSPERLLEFLNDKFSAIDENCSRHQVQKIETVGEEYVAAVGVIPRDQEAIEIEGYPEVLGRMIRVVDEILRSSIGQEVQYKLGMHTGPIVAGVIGQKLPRFRLFGDTINTAARMMQKGEPGECQFGEETKKVLPDWVKYRRRGHVEMKGKGKVMVYQFDKMDNPLARSATNAESEVSLNFNDTFTTRSKGRKSLVNELMIQKQHAALAVEHIDVDPSEIPKVTHLSVFSDSGGKRSSAKQSSIDARSRTSSSASRQPPEAKRESPRREVELSDMSNSSPKIALLGNEADKSPKSRRVQIATGESFDEPVREVSMSISNPEGVRVSRQEDQEDRRRQEESSKFDKLLEEVKAKEMQQAAWRPNMRQFLNICPERQGFTEDMERRWFQWYHRETICKKLASRFDRQALFFSALFAFDTFVMVWWRKAESWHDVYGTSLRFPVFLLSRGLSIFIMMSWRVVAAASENSSENWVMNFPKQVQFRILASYLFIGFLMFISYDAMTTQELQKRDGEGFVEIKEKILHENKRETSFYSLWLGPIFFIVITSFQLLFAPTCCFICLAGCLMLMTYVPGYGGLYFSNQGKFLFILNSVMNAYLARTAESTSRSRFKARHVMEVSQNRIETILNTLMPTMVVEELRELAVNAVPPAHPYKRATIAQSDLCGFTKLASTRKPEEVVKFIGELFGLFDALTDRYEIYKVETVGDAYIAGQAEAPLTSKNKPINVLLFGLDMVKATHEWSRGMGENVSCRVGVHSGECIGGIVGTEMQRYHLFGGLMRGLEVLESTAPEGLALDISKS